MFTTTEHKERICNSILTILLLWPPSRIEARVLYGSRVAGCLSRVACRESPVASRLSPTPLLINQTARKESSRINLLFP